MGITPILSDTITPGKTGTSFNYDPPGPFHDHKSHVLSEDPAEPDSQDDPNEANS